MTPRLIAIAGAFAFTAGAACAQVADGGFSALDADGSGGISLAELAAAAPDATAETFAAYDFDGSGELSADEYAAWASNTAGGGQ